MNSVCVIFNFIKLAFILLRFYCFYFLILAYIHRRFMYWSSYLLQGRREQELRAVPKWRKYWKLIQRKDTPEMREKLDWERRFLQRIMVKFMKLLESVEVKGWYIFMIMYCIYVNTTLIFFSKPFT